MADLMTFAEISEKARKLINVEYPATGGVMGVRKDMVLMSALAEALDLFEHNMAYWLATMNMDSEIKKDPEMFKARLAEAVAAWRITLRSPVYVQEMDRYGPQVQL